MDAILNTTHPDNSPGSPLADIFASTAYTYDNGSSSPNALAKIFGGETSLERRSIFVDDQNITSSYDTDFDENDSHEDDSDDTDTEHTEESHVPCMTDATRCESNVDDTLSKPWCRAIVSQVQKKYDDIVGSSTKYHRSIHNPLGCEEQSPFSVKTKKRLDTKSSQGSIYLGTVHPDGASRATPVAIKVTSLVSMEDYCTLSAAMTTLQQLTTAQTAGSKKSERGHGPTSSSNTSKSLDISKLPESVRPRAEKQTRRKLTIEQRIEQESRIAQNCTNQMQKHIDDFYGNEATVDAVACMLLEVLRSNELSPSFLQCFETSMIRNDLIFDAVAIAKFGDAYDLGILSQRIVMEMAGNTLHHLFSQPPPLKALRKHATVSSTLEGPSSAPSHSISTSASVEKDVFFWSVRNFKDVAVSSRVQWQSDVVLGVLAQLVFALAIAQYYFSMVHNDLHTKNVMYMDTPDIPYYYYCRYDSQADSYVYYRVPTFGKTMKIIDLGFSSFHIGEHAFVSNGVKRREKASGRRDTRDATCTEFRFDDKHVDLVRLVSSFILKKTTAANATGDKTLHINLDDPIDAWMDSVLTTSTGVRLVDEYNKTIASAKEDKDMKRAFFKVFVHGPGSFYEMKKGIPSANYNIFSRFIIDESDIPENEIVYLIPQSLA